MLVRLVGASFVLGAAIEFFMINVRIGSETFCESSVAAKRRCLACCGVQTQEASHSECSAVKSVAVLGVFVAFSLVFLWTLFVCMYCLQDQVVSFCLIGLRFCRVSFSSYNLAA
jgi:hypothetical protein